MLKSSRYVNVRASLSSSVMQELIPSKTPKEILVTVNAPLCEGTWMGHLLQ